MAVAYAAPPVAQLQAAIAAIQATIAGVPAIESADPATLASLQAQTRTAIPLAVQVVNFYDAAMIAVGAPANFAAGTDPVAMVGNVGVLLATSAALQSALDVANKLSRFAINLNAVVAPSAEIADIDHTFGQDVGVSATNDIGLVTGWLRTAQRVIRRLCTPQTDALPQVTALAVSSGDDLFRIAAALYNDATAWSLIAAANGLADPLIQTDQVLAIPAYSAARVNDGILPVPGSAG